MLKKLVKYGNSTALVLDKPILELLNIEEGGFVKLRTDGRSLNVEPQGPISEKISPTTVPFESLKNAITSVWAENAQMKEDRVKNNFEKIRQVTEEFLVQRNAASLPFEMGEFKEYLKAQVEKNNINKDALNIDLMDRYYNVHQKYKEVLNKFGSIKMSSDFINESVLLTEKYKDRPNNKEYIEEYGRLITKFIPE